MWAQSSQIGASQIKVPVGSVFQKYVYTCFMVKMRIDLGSFGLFGLFRLGIMYEEGICQVRIFGFMRLKGSSLEV